MAGYDSTLTGAQMQEAAEWANNAPGYGAYPTVNKGTSTASTTLNPNTFYTWGVVGSVTISGFGAGTAKDTGTKEYIFQFTSNSGGTTTLSLPSSVKWTGGSAPTIEANTVYQVSVVNNMALYASFPA